MSGLRLPGGLAIEDLAFDKAAGLLPVVVQDSTDGRVLMVGYADRAALRATLDTGLATFHSRSRGTRWVKGETSGNTLRVVAVEVDCDRDTV
ncbi:MAG: phosphoribosyl-AMP cyclohydrolase, partial [Actinomycetota bacterium]|nr:phosphoribosyl-AMP cyclohydrolase [Actinomycetota bacterium]